MNWFIDSLKNLCNESICGLQINQGTVVSNTVYIFQRRLCPDYFRHLSRRFFATGKTLQKGEFILDLFKVFNICKIFDWLAALSN